MPNAPTPDAPTTTPTLVYYDGWCSACIRTAKLLTKLDRDRGRLACVDLRSDDPRLPLVELDTDTLASSLHTRAPDGSITAGPEAIRQAMNAVGKGLSLSWTRWWPMRPVVDLFYKIFARNRLRWFATHECKDGACSIDPSADPSPDP